MRTARTNRTVELFKEFYSYEMGKARIEAQDFLRANPTTNYDDYARRADARPVREVIYCNRGCRRRARRGDDGVDATLLRSDGPA